MKAKTIQAINKARHLTHLTRLSLALFCSVVAVPAYAQGIPVIDASSIAQQVQQVLSWGQQLKAMEEQFHQAQQQLESLTGNRGFGEILNNPELQQYIKDEFPEVDALRQQFSEMNPCKSLTNPEAMQYCQSVSNQPYQNYDQIGQALKTATGKTQQIQDLIKEISNTDDPKSIAELQGRIQGEQAAIQNEMVRMQLTQQRMQIQNELVKEQQSQAVLDRFMARSKAAGL